MSFNLIILSQDFCGILKQKSSIDQNLPLLEYFPDRLIPLVNTRGEIYRPTLHETCICYAHSFLLLFQDLQLQVSGRRLFSALVTRLL